LVSFAARVIRLGEKMPATPTSRHITLQLVRAGTSGGANYAEARAAESRADFAHKIGVAAKELREALYWLTVIRQSELVTGDLSPLMREADELIAILIASRNTARTNAKRPQSLIPDP